MFMQQHTDIYYN